MSDRFGSEGAGSADDVDDLLGAFALDAVDPAEHALVERHLAADPAARAEVDEMRETAAALASLPADDEGAPAGLWDRIADSIGAPALSVVPDPPVERSEPVVVPLRGSKRSIPARVFTPLAAAAAIVIVVLSVSLATRNPSRAGDLAAAYSHAVSSGTARAVPLQAAADHGQVAAEIAWQPDGTGFLRNDHLAALPAGQTYQLWATFRHGSKVRAISAGVLGPQPTDAAFHLAGTPTAFAITVEKAPGVVASKNAPVAAGTVPQPTA